MGQLIQLNDDASFAAAFAKAMPTACVFRGE